MKASLDTGRTSLMNVSTRLHSSLQQEPKVGLSYAQIHKFQGPEKAKNSIFCDIESL